MTEAEKKIADICDEAWQDLVETVDDAIADYHPSERGPLLKVVEQYDQGLGEVVRDRYTEDDDHWLHEGEEIDPDPNAEALRDYNASRGV